MRREHKCRHCGEWYAWDDDAPPSQHHDGIGCEVITLRSKLDTARQLLEKIAAAVNDPLLSQRVRISIASDIAAYLEPKP